MGVGGLRSRCASEDDAQHDQGDEAEDYEAVEGGSEGREELFAAALDEAGDAEPEADYGYEHAAEKQEREEEEGGGER